MSDVAEKQHTRVGVYKLDEYGQQGDWITFIYPDNVPHAPRAGEIQVNEVWNRETKTWDPR